MVNNCLIINMDHRTDLWNNLEQFRNDWSKSGKTHHRMSGTSYINKQNILNEYINTNRINLNGNGFRNTKTSFLGELGCYDSHYNCWKYVVDNEIDSCLILEDGISILRNDFKSMVINKKLDLLFVNEEMKMNTENQFVGYGLQGYIVTLKGAQNLLKLCSTLTAPIDLQIRHFCNTKELNAVAITLPFVKRNHNRASSIEGFVLNDQDNLNSKQNQNSIIQRILFKLLEENVNLDDYI